MDKKFNKNQLKAVEHVNGPCLVLAGPGSGKTFVLINRVFRLITKEYIEPDSILVLTFTRNAANEMKERFLSLISDENIKLYSMPTFGTFHSVFFEILKNDFEYNANSLVDAADERKILVDILEKYKKIKLNFDLVNDVIKDIKKYKLYIEKNEFFEPKSLDKKVFNKVYKEYQNKLYLNRKLDYSDMISKCKELLLKDKKVLSYYQDKYKYVLIDEFQDINMPQYDLVKLIAKTKNIFAVGDDDQSIYGFRGSSPNIMNKFIRDYRNTKTVYLTENYRCARKIVKFSKIVIAYNENRFDKDLVSNRVDIGKLEIKAFVDAKTENEYIIKLIKEYLFKGIKLSEMAILYRTNLLVNAIKKDLKNSGINYKEKGKQKSVYDNFAIKDIISYLKIAIDENTEEELLNIANKPVRYISRDSILYNDGSIKKLTNYYKNKDFIYKNLTKLENDFNIIKKSLPALAIRYIRDKIGYDKYIINFCTDNELDVDEILDLLDAFEDEAVAFNDISKFLEYISTADTKIENNDDSINLMTFHLSKGLEFKVVFIIDANDGLIPHKKSIREGDLETERRLFYVGMTRAKDYLYIFFTTRRFGKNFEASRFIIEAVGGQDGK